MIDFGLQPPSNRFVTLGAHHADRHRLKFAVCPQCGLSQIIDPMPVANVKSRYAWLTYKEPENHLDDLAGRLTKLPSVGPRSRVMGLSYKDDTLLARLQRLGMASPLRFDMKNDLGIDDACAGIESIQAAVHATSAQALVRAHGHADLMLVRHVLEHAHDALGFLRAVGEMVTAGGYVVLEMPDCTKFLTANDYSFLWEEHITYFSRATIAPLAQRAGFAIADVVLYPFPFEDSLIVILRKDGAVQLEVDAKAAAEHVAAARRYAKALGPAREHYQAYFKKLRGEGKRLALFGAGHLAAKFVNLLELAEYFSCVIDDNPHKQGLAMPGSGLPIVGSAALAEIDLCMLSLSPESERKVLQKQQGYLERGGQFASIFTLSPLALKLS